MKTYEPSRNGTLTSVALTMQRERFGRDKRLTSLDLSTPNLVSLVANMVLQLKP